MMLAFAEKRQSNKATKKSRQIGTRKRTHMKIPRVTDIGSESANNQARHDQNTDENIIERLRMKAAGLRNLKPPILGPKDIRDKLFSITDQLWSCVFQLVPGTTSRTAAILGAANPEKEKEALRKCLRLLWEQYLDRKGKPYSVCPYSGLFEHAVAA